MAQQYRADLLVSCVHDRPPEVITALENEIKQGLEKLHGRAPELIRR